MGASPNQGERFGGPHIKDDHILGLHLGPPILGNSCYSILAYGM